jgi:hypothetical protein
MPATVFPCYPFAHFFEEEVTQLLASKLDSRFYLIHNVMRPNKRRKSLFPKEIDLCVLSRTGKAYFIEIKNYIDPEIDDVSIEGKFPNPVQEMKEYGQRFRSDFKYNSRSAPQTPPILILRRKDPNRINPKWHLNCFEPKQFVTFLLNESRTLKNIYDEVDLDEIRREYFCCVKVRSFNGFGKQDVDSLRMSDKYTVNARDEEFKKDVVLPLYYKFRCLAYEVRSAVFGKDGISLYQQLMDPEQTMPRPIYWVAFTLRDVDPFLNDPQFGFHISARDWFNSGSQIEDHIAVKLGFFEGSEWMRKILMAFRRDPARFVEKIRKHLRIDDFLLTSSRDPDENFISSPVKSPGLFDDLEYLAECLLGRKPIKLRSLCFERPYYLTSYDLVENKGKLVEMIRADFQILHNLLLDLLPEYRLVAKL